MSCFPWCPVPEFILPKHLRREKKYNCIGLKCKKNCTKVRLCHIKGRPEKCMHPELAENVRCVVCQDERLKRMAYDRKSQNMCWLQNHVRTCPEIPFIMKPPLEGIQFLRFGFNAVDCFPQNVVENPCQQRAAWRKKTKKWIKDLDKHYNERVIETCAQPVENYIRLNLANLCDSCEAVEHQRLAAQKPPLKPGCVMVEKRCYCAKSLQTPGH